MYTVSDLFDQRSAFSAKLEQIMDSLSITKAKLCKEAGISRPTLDKLLATEITNQANFEKHITKILDYLHLTPDAFMGNTHNTYNRIRQLKNILHISEESISKVTGIPLSRLKDIEAGADATTSELRDIALCCKTSTRGILGTNYFDTPLAEYAYYIQKDSSKEISGFWGHIGILPVSSDEYLWFPISSDVRRRIYHTMDQDFLVIPCMNNKVLFLNMSGISNLVLLDEACGQPSFANWDPSVSEGEIPLVVYESLDDYFFADDSSENILSSLMRSFLDDLVEEKHWTEDDTFDLLNRITIYYKTQKPLSLTGYLDTFQTLTDAIESVFDFEELDPEERVIYFEDSNGCEIILNLNNISMIELPLLATEKVICQKYEEMSKEP